MGKKKAALLMLIFLSVVTLSFPIELRSEIYKYVDKEGTVHFVDDESKIPSEYRDDVTITVYEDKSDHLPGEEEGEIEGSQGRGTEEWLEEREREREQIAREEYEKSLQTKVTIQGNHVLVPVKLGYKGTEVETLLVLDTGADLVAIHREVAQQLQITYSKRAEVRVTGGKTIYARLAKLDYVQVGPYKRTDINVLILWHSGPAVPHNGLLGMNFLRDLEYSIDFKNQLIKWKP